MKNLKMGLKVGTILSIPLFVVFFVASMLVGVESLMIFVKLGVLCSTVIYSFSLALSLLLNDETL